jgi:hypothetical protein
MTDGDYKKYTAQAKAAIKGEAFFEALVSDYCIPHRIVGPKDMGIDYICEWVYGDKPTGILFAVQVKTLSARNVRRKCIGPNKGWNELIRYKIASSHLCIDERTLQYWRGLGIPVFLFAIVYAEPIAQGGQLDCYYKRFTPALTTKRKQEEEDFYKVSDGAAFLAFADPEYKRYGFARDLFVDLMRCSYSKGSISYISPRMIGLEQFPKEDAVFGDLFEEYALSILRTYAQTNEFLERIRSDQGEPSAERQDE